MSWSFRRSINLGPFRLTFSNSGISYSFGMAGFRTGVNAKGRRYSSVSIPGTGVRYSTTHGTSDKAKSSNASVQSNASPKKSRKKPRVSVDEPSDQSR